MNGECEHFDQKHIIESKNYECEECLKTGDEWVHLRTCQTCGVTLCCDNSLNRHATRHAMLTGHPVVISAEPGEKWAWCYMDEMYMRYYF
jgi:3-deoxy-D-manno-octulosonate 8-phosphate phosphatase KdsC-like HAD superfamily phosphatase